MLFIHAHLMTMEPTPTGFLTIEDGFLLTQDGRIQNLGPMSQCPALSDFPAQEVYDLAGKSVYPGFIDAHCHMGLAEEGLNFEGDDLNEMTDPVTPHLRGIDAINPLNKSFSEAVDAAITTVITGPGSANAIGGQFCAIKTFGHNVDRMVLKAPVAMKFALGENPKTVYHGKNLAPNTRMATASLIREQLTKAQRYRQDKNKALEDEESFDPPEYDAKCEALLPLLERKIPAHFHAHRADDIFTALRIAAEFDLRFVIVHGTEGHLIADILAGEEVRVLAGPILCDRSKPELRNLTPANPGLLAGAGVQTAIITDHPVIPVQYLPLCAALAVREGMEEGDALRAITITPARICGLDRRVGSIAPGKDADLAVFDQHPLSFSAKPRLVFCGGKRVKG